MSTLPSDRMPVFQGLRQERAVRDGAHISLNEILECARAHLEHVTDTPEFREGAATSATPSGVMYIGDGVMWQPIPLNAALSGAVFHVLTSLAAWSGFSMQLFVLAPFARIDVLFASGQFWSANRDGDVVTETGPLKVTGFPYLGRGGVQ